MVLYRTACITTAGLLLAALILTGCGKKPPADDIFAPVKEQTRDTGFALCEIPNFAGLTLQEKLLAHYLSAAVIAGDPIVYKQLHPDGYQIKLLVDGAVSHSAGMEERLLAGMQEYTKLFWANHSFYDRASGIKFIPLLDKNKFMFSVVVALSNGAKVGLTAHNELNSLMQELSPVIFDSTFEGAIFSPRQRRWDADITSGIFRAGNDTLLGGACAPELTNIIDNLNSARQHIDADGGNLLGLLNKYFETGDANYYAEYLRGWIEYHGKIEWALGFFPADSGADINGRLYAGLVILPDNDRQDVIDKIRDNYRDFLKLALENPDSMQIDFTACNVTAGNLLTAAGETGYNIPEVFYLENADSGAVISKSLVLTNAAKAKSDFYGQSGRRREAKITLTLLKESLGRPTSRSLLANIPAENSERSFYEELTADMIAVLSLKSPAAVELGLLNEPLDDSFLVETLRDGFLNQYCSASAGPKKSPQYRAHRIIFNLTFADTSGDFPRFIRGMLANALDEYGKISPSALAALMQYDGGLHLNDYAQYKDELARKKLPASVKVVTPFTELSLTKMGKPQNVILDYPASVLEYGIKIAEASLTLE